jgi:hypothetical protein
VTVHVPHVRLLPQPSNAEPGVPARRLDGLTVMLLLVGLVPLGGLALLGRWPEWELGAGAAMSLFALAQLARLEGRRPD